MASGKIKIIMKEVLYVFVPVVFAALSIDSLYPEIIFNLRDRICVFEGDLEKLPKRKCDSLKDGPFCMPINNQHIPNVVDGISSRVLNDWHLNSKQRVYVLRFYIGANFYFHA